MVECMNHKLQFNKLLSFSFINFFSNYDLNPYQLSGINY